MWTMPSIVSSRAAWKLDVGSRPIVRSVPGPSKCSASKRCALSRPAASVSASARLLQTSTGSGSSRRQTCRPLLADREHAL
jgi:hypothetical protein